LLCAPAAQGINIHRLKANTAGILIASVYARTCCALRPNLLRLTPEPAAPYARTCCALDLFTPNTVYAERSSPLRP
jgi:hypothetical protein